MDFPRPHGVMQAEAMAMVDAFVLDEPTLSQAYGLLWMTRTPAAQPSHLRLSEMSVTQLVESAAEAQSYFRDEMQRSSVNRDKARSFYRVMRGAQLVLATRATQKIGGPFHA